MVENLIQTIKTFQNVGSYIISCRFPQYSTEKKNYVCDCPTEFDRILFFSISILRQIFNLGKLF